MVGFRVAKSCRFSRVVNILTSVRLPALPWEPAESTNWGSLGVFRMMPVILTRAKKQV